MSAPHSGTPRTQTIRSAVPLGRASSTASGTSSEASHNDAQDHVPLVAGGHGQHLSDMRAAQQQLIGMQSKNHRLDEEVELLEANRIQTATQRRTITAGALQAGAINNALTQERATMTTARAEADERVRVMQLQLDEQLAREQTQKAEAEARVAALIERLSALERAHKAKRVSKHHFEHERDVIGSLIQRHSDSDW